MRYQSCLLGILLALPSASSGADRTAGATAILNRFAATEAGVSVAIIDNEKFIKLSRGMANLETRTPVTSATNFRLASLTKQFTATAILLLAEDKKLNLHQSIDHYFPEFPKYAQFVTIRDLLTHTGGLWDYEDLIPSTQTTPFKDAEAVAFSAAHATPAFSPGTKFQYSNTGYAALAEIVRKVSGMRFAEFLKTRVFEPAGMTNTVAHEEGLDTVANRAYGYTGRKKTDQNLTSAVLGDGGIYSSIDDMIDWSIALDHGKVLPASVVEDSTRTGRLTSGEPLRYNCGWFLDPYKNQRSTWHSGETIGFRTAIQRFPDRKLTVIVLSNRNDLDARKLSLELADIYLQ